jgi:hypothetical protein
MLVGIIVKDMVVVVVAATGDTITAEMEVGTAAADIIANTGVDIIMDTAMDTGTIVTLATILTIEAVVGDMVAKKLPRIKEATTGVGITAMKMGATNIVQDTKLEIDTPKR